MLDPELKALLDLPGSKPVLIDSRTVGEYQEAHINGAVNLPLPQQEANPGALPYPRTDRIIFYCNGFS